MVRPGPWHRRVGTLLGGVWESGETSGSGMVECEDFGSVVGRAELNITKIYDIFACLNYYVLVIAKFTRGCR